MPNKGYFYSVLDKITPSLEEEETPGGILMLPYDKQLLMFLWFVSNGDSFREISLMFKVSKGTAHVVMNRIANVLCSLRHRVTTWLGDERKTLISQKCSESLGTLGCIGCIGGIHVRLAVKPSEDDDDINRKCYPSIQLQVKTDFLHIFYFHIFLYMSMNLIVSPCCYSNIQLDYTIGHCESTININKNAGYILDNCCVATIVNRTVISL